MNGTDMMDGDSRVCIEYKCYDQELTDAVVLVCNDAFFGYLYNDIHLDNQSSLQISSGMKIVHFTLLSDAYSWLKSNKAVAIVLDVDIIDFLGAEDVAKISRNYPDLPLVISGYDDRLSLDFVKLGAQDYILKKDCNNRNLCKVIEHSIARKSIESKFKVGIAYSVRVNDLLRKESMYDPLTGLVGRVAFNEMVIKTISRARRKSLPFGVIYFDLDGFKKINDKYGHDAGDHVLKEVAIRAKSVLRSEDTLARMGGDEFLVVSDLLQDSSQAYSIASHINGALKQCITHKGNEMYVGMSAGIAIYPQSDSLESLVKHSDVAMYEAKHKKSHFVHFYTPHLDKAHKRYMDIQAGLLSSIQRDNLGILCQPVIDVCNESVVALEVLTCWSHSDLGPVSPKEFIPVADSCGVNDQLTELVMRLFLEVDMSESIFSRECIKRVSFNITARQLNGIISKSFRDLVEEFAAKGFELCLEISEVQLMSDIGIYTASLNKLRNLGVKLILDNYGSGQSSITHLINLPIDQIKIDRSIIKNIHKSSFNQEVVKALIAITRGLGVEVVAVGVEDEQELEVLVHSLGCNLVQGYMLAKPASLTDQHQLCQ